jgi:crotonobetaine/carnitine-CoA ligase
VLSHEAVLHLTRHLVWLMDYDESDRLFTTFPLFHNNAKYTSVTAAMEAGGCVVIDPKFTASGFWNRMREKEITAFNYMGALLMMLHKQEPRPDDRENPVRIAFGAPCPVDIWEDFEARFNMKLVEVYGMTEAPMACENRLDDRRIGAAGKSSMTYEVIIGDENDQPCAPGVPGEILVRPKHPWALFTEYYKNPSATVEAWRNLWFHTGDRGKVDDEGFVFFIDRMKDCIRRRGENISSWEVESCINLHPAVEESAAYGVASDLSESEVMIAVVVKPDLTVRPEQLLDHCQGSIAHFAIPRYVRFIGSSSQAQARWGQCSVGSLRRPAIRSHSPTSINGTLKQFVSGAFSCELVLVRNDAFTYLRVLCQMSILTSPTPSWSCVKHGPTQNWLHCFSPRYIPKQSSSVFRTVLARRTR